MSSEDFVNYLTLKIECLYVEVKQFHFIAVLVSQCKLAYELFF